MTASTTRLSLSFIAALVIMVFAYSIFGLAVGNDQPHLKIIATVVAHAHAQQVSGSASDVN